VVRFALNATRSIEPFVWALVFVTWFRLGPFPGMVALMVHSVAALGKLYSEQVESIDPGPVEAVRSTGASELQTVLYAVIPQIIPPFISFTIYRWDVNVRMSTIIGLVGGGGIGQMLFQYQNLAQWRKTSVAIILIVTVVMVLDNVSARIRERIM
jgi:phosphonate transport system permease protein